MKNLTRPIGFLVLVGLLSVLLLIEHARFSIGQVSAFAAVSSLVALATLARLRGVWAASTVFATIVFVFHIPLALFPLTGTVADVYGAPMDWFYGAHGAPVVVKSNETRPA